MGGGCSMPVGAYALCEGDELTLYGMLGSTDGEKIIRGTMHGAITDPNLLAQKLAEKLLHEAPWYHIKK
jgi:hydroxymethylbilane synthase